MREGYIKTTKVRIMFKGKQIVSYRDENGFLYNKKNLTIYAQIVDGKIIDLTSI